MSTWVWIVIAVLVVVVLALVVRAATRARRSRSLQEGFGREYDRTVEETGGRREGERELIERQKRHDALDRLRSKKPKATSSTPGGRQKLQPFVIANGIDTHSCSSRQFTNSKLCLLHDTLSSTRQL